MATHDQAFNLNDLAIFVEIAKRNSISKTAEIIGVASSTLSRRLSILETHLGVQLLARNTRKMALTEAGKLYFERCRNVLEQALSATEALQEEGRRPCGKLKVLLPDALDSLNVVDVISDMLQSSTDLSVDCEYAHDAVLLEDREFDVALRWGTQADNDMTARMVGKFPFHLYASPAYLARIGQPMLPDDLAAHDCLLVGTCPELLSWRLESDGERWSGCPQGRMRATSLDITKRLAQAGAGIAALPSMQTCDETLVRVMDNWMLPPIALYAIYGSRTPPASARAFVEALIDAAQGRG